MNWAFRSAWLTNSGSVGWGLAQPRVEGMFCGLPAKDPSRLLWNGQHPEPFSLIRGDRQGKEQDCFLAIVSPRTAFAASILLEAHKPILLCMLLGYVGVVMVLLQPFQEQAFLTWCLLKGQNQKRVPLLGSSCTQGSSLPGCVTLGKLLKLSKSLLQGN